MVALPNIEALKAGLFGTSNNKNVVITTHHKPDADALGSSLALYNYLIKKPNLTVTVLSPTDYPNFLNWMPGQNKVINFEANKVLGAKLVAEADYIFCLDFSSIGRINDLGDLVLASKAQKVMIDHHLFPEDFAQFVLHSTAAAATAELIFQFIDMMGDKALIDIPIAECIYAGILTDTGSFRHPSTTQHVHLVIADLIGLGVIPNRVHKLIYDTSSENRLRFLGFALADRLTVLPKYHTAFIAISKEDLKRFNSQTGDTEGVVNFALSIEGIVFAAIIVDRTEMVKISFRSAGKFSANQFARDNFEGGGHENAAGGKSTQTLDITVEKFLALLPKYKEELVNAADHLFDEAPIS